MALKGDRAFMSGGFWLAKGLAELHTAAWADKIDRFGMILEHTIGV